MAFLFLGLLKEADGGGGGEGRAQGMGLGYNYTNSVLQRLLARLLPPPHPPSPHYSSSWAQQAFSLGLLLECFCPPCTHDHS